MSADETMRGAQDPAALYSERLKQLQGEQAAEQKQERLFGYAKVAVAFFTLLSAVILLYYTNLLWLLLLPAIVFLWLAVLHEKRLQKIRWRQRAIAFYEHGVARMEDRWAGTGETGDRFVDDSPLCARSRSFRKSIVV